MSIETRNRLIRYGAAALAVINLIALFVFNYGLKDPSFGKQDYHAYLGEETGIQDDREAEGAETDEESPQDDSSDTSETSEE